MDGSRDLMEAYRRVGLRPGMIAYVVSALWQVANPKEKDLDALTQAHLAALRRVLGPDGTIVVPTATVNLCNTDVPFDVETTPSFNAGMLSEHVRLAPGTRRSFHPFGSYAALGAQAESIVANVSRHMFGPETPEARMIEMGAMAVNVGLPPNICSTVHHVEHVMAVPYRYTKEFMHPVKRDDGVRREPFYLHVRYLGIGVERSYNKTLFARLKGRLPIAEVSLGRGRICAYSLADFYHEAKRIFADDIYVWCDAPPRLRPYRK